MDWWHYVASLPAPKIVVIADVDHIPGTGAFVGEIHARIARALGCVAYVTNGTVRDIEGLRGAGLQCFASGTSVSHAYAHIIEFGEPVDLGGLTISTGDLLHGDCHGIQTIPHDIADKLPAEVELLVQREVEMIQFCQSTDFSLRKLDEILNRESASCQPPRHR
jgi:regulator of RNase E activity RraA